MKVSGRCQEGVRKVSGSCLWKSSRRCHKGVWELSGRYLEGVCNLSGNCQEGVWKVSDCACWTNTGCLESHKIFGTNIFWDSNFLGHYFFVAKNLFNPQIFGPKNFQIIFLDKNVFKTPYPLKIFFHTPYHIQI